MTSLVLNNWALVAKWLALPTPDHKVLGLNPTGGWIQLTTMALHCTEPFIITLSLAQYDLIIPPTYEVCGGI